jgi:hypothetical protein
MAVAEQRPRDVYGMCLLAQEKKGKESRERVLLRWDHHSVGLAELRRCAPFFFFLYLSPSDSRSIEQCNPAELSSTAGRQVPSSPLSYFLKNHFLAVSGRE